MQNQARERLLQMKKILLIGIVFLVLLAMPIYAEQNLGTFKKGNCINLMQICDNCTYVNFTSVMYPDGTFEILNLNATKQGTMFNHSFCNTSYIGTYIINSEGDLGGIVTSGSFKLYISSSGIERTDNPIGIIVPIFSLLINGIILLFAFKKNIIKNEFVNFILKRSLMVFGMFLLVLNSAIIAGVAEYAGLDLTKEMFMFIEIFGWAGYAAIIILIFTSIAQFMKAWKIKKKNKRMGNE